MLALNEEFGEGGGGGRDLGGQEGGERLEDTELNLDAFADDGIERVENLGDEMLQM